MSVWIVGTGRSGTMTAAAAFDGMHEPYSELFVPLAALYRVGRYSLDDAAMILDKFAAWEEMGVSAHYKYAELLPVIRVVDPDAHVVWVRRDPEATVDSMMRKGWYDHRWDELWPIQFHSWIVRHGRPALHFNLNHEAFRTNPVMMGWLSWREWVAWSQERRCRWWVAYCSELIRLQSPDEMVVLEDAGWEALNVDGV